VLLQVRQETASMKNGLGAIKENADSQDTSMIAIAVMKTSNTAL
jgi:hypothetical protein